MSRWQQVQSAAVARVMARAEWQAVRCAISLHFRCFHLRHYCPSFVLSFSRRFFSSPNTHATITTAFDDARDARKQKRVPRSDHWKQRRAITPSMTSRQQSAPDVAFPPAKQTAIPSSPLVRHIAQISLVFRITRDHIEKAVARFNIPLSS
jgi:hypothetical protein